MPIPERIPIMRIEDYHTHYVGEVNDGRQFWGYQTFVFSKPYGEIKAEDWQKFRREYVVLHTFDSNGFYLKTDHWYGGTTDIFNDEEGIDKMEELISSLGKIEYTDIAVKPFTTTIDGFTFGLIPNYEEEVVDLQPSSTICFHEPWDGEYDT